MLSEEGCQSFEETFSEVQILKVDQKKKLKDQKALSWFLMVLTNTFHLVDHKTDKKKYPITSFEEKSHIYRPEYHRDTAAASAIH